MGWRRPAPGAGERAATAHPSGDEASGHGWQNLFAALVAHGYAVALGLYRRLVERGKLDEVALIAAMRKLLAAVYFVAKDRCASGPSMTSTQEP